MLSSVAVPFYVFAQQTTAAAYSLVANGVVVNSRVADFQHLLQRHRTVVLRLTRSWDEHQIAAAPAELQKLGRDLEAALAEVPYATLDRKDLSTDPIKPTLLSLFSTGESVAELGALHAGTAALYAATRTYTEVSDTLLDAAERWRDLQSNITHNEVRRLFTGADAMARWANGGALVAVILGCLGLVISHRLIRRLWQMRDCMLRLAARDLLVEIPHQTDQDEIGSMARAIQVFKDNALQAAVQDRELRQANIRFEAALNNMSQGICMYDGAGRLDMFNQQYCKVFNLNPAEVKLGRSLLEILRLSFSPENCPGQDYESFIVERANIVANREAGLSIIEVKGGRLISVVHRPMPNGGYVATFEDVTERRAAEAQIAHMARHDSLTGLPNRLVLQERIEQQLIDAGRGGRSAVLFLDLDHFKHVNDALGHRIGDILLRAVADRLLACVREGDTVARLGGDEFAIVQAGITRPEDVQLLAERVIRTLASPFRIDEHDIVVGTSIGIALIPEDGTCTATLLKNADMALYRSKSEKRGTFCFFEAEMDARLQLRRQLELDLRTGLANDELELYYQPMVSPVTEQVVGFEALLRWRHPIHGMVSPAEFIPIAEETGLIIPIGEWVIKTACAEAVEWPDQIKVALNLSPIQFGSRNLVPTVAFALRDTGLAAGRLELEVTETVLLQDSESTIAMLHDLRALGAQISMDDFGTGYSSLSYLRRFPFDKIKIDQSFIRDLSQREESIHIVRAIRGLCAGLSMKTTAEGVETEEQFAKIRAEGCTEAQGYLFSPPRPGKEVSSIIRDVRARGQNRTSFKAPLTASA